MMLDFSSFIDGSNVPISNYKNLQYTGEAFIGDPSQSVKFLFDTGSSQAWLFGKEHCEKTQFNVHSCPTNAAAFQESKSSQLNVTDDIEMLAYAVGKVYGLVSSDQFCFQENEGCL